MTYLQALNVVRSRGLAMLEHPGGNIEAVAVGNKAGGPLVGVTNYCVTAYVKEKLTEDELSDRGIASFSEVFASSIGTRNAERFDSEVDINIVECGSSFKINPHPDPLHVTHPTGGALVLADFTVPAAQRGQYGGNPPSLNAQRQFQNLRIGIGITNPAEAYPDLLGVGTIGFFMRDGGGNLYVVSNNHVIGRVNEAAPGEIVVQPGTLDFTDTELQSMPGLQDVTGSIGIAELAGVVELKFPDANGTPNNRVDAAIARLTTSGRGTSDLDRLTFGGGLRGARELRVDQNGTLQPSSRVFKVGRTTGYTEGRITGIAGVSFVTYGNKSAHFVDQIVIEPTEDNQAPFSLAGDSGSAILNDRNEAVGLLFAGSRNQTLANPIMLVIEQLRQAAGIPDLEVVTI